MGRKPDLEGREPTEAQQAQREQFRQAAVWQDGDTCTCVTAGASVADSATKAIYEEAAKAKGQPVFSLTVADFFNAPSVDEVDLSAYAGRVGDAIAIRAHDDLMARR